MFDNLAVIIETKDIDASIVVIARPMLVAVQDNMLPLCKGSLEGHTLTGIVGGHASEVIDERVLAVSDMRIVLDIDRSDIALDRFARPALVEHHVIKRHGVCFVGFHVIRQRFLPHPMHPLINKRPVNVFQPDQRPRSNLTFPSFFSRSGNTGHREDSATP